MSTDTTFEQKWLPGVSFRVGEAPRFAHLCQPGQTLADYCETRVAPIRSNPTEVTVNQALLLIFDRFLTIVEGAQRGHRTFGTPKHCCAATVLISYALELRELRWRISPPLLREASAPAALPQFEIAGVPFGIKK